MCVNRVAVGAIYRGIVTVKHLIVQIAHINCIHDIYERVLCTFFFSLASHHWRCRTKYIQQCVVSSKKKKSSSEFNVSSHLTDKGNNVFVVWTFAWVYTQKIDINELSEGLFIANVNGLKWRKIGSERNPAVCRRTRTCGLGQSDQNIQCIFGHKYVVQISYRIIRLCFISQFFLICDMFLFVCWLL